MKSTPRVNKFREGQALLNRFKREAYLTDEEWGKVKIYILSLRD